MHQLENPEEFVLQALCMACSIDRSRLTPETELQTTGLDSLSLTAIVARLEANYTCEFSSTQIMDLFQASVVGDLVRKLTDAISAQRALRHQT
jgi:acyl carrier protein